MLQEIINALKQSENYSLLLEIANKYKLANKNILNSCQRKQNEWNKNKLIYSLIKRANEKDPSLKLEENNFEQKLSEYKITTITKQPEKPNPKIKDTKLPKSLLDLIPEEKTPEEYAKWFYKQPETIQKMLKEKGALYRKRGVLHTKNKTIGGNTKPAIEARKTNLILINEITLKIKQIHSITDHYFKTGKLILS